MSILLLSNKRTHLPSGLQALYAFDEGAGQTLVDQSGNGHDVTLGSTGGPDGNDPLWIPEGLRFSTDRYVDGGGFMALRPEHWTICAVVRQTPGVPVPLLGWGSTSFPSVYVAAPFNSNRPLIWLANGCFRYFESTSPVNLQDDGWHFVAFRCPGNTIAAIEGSSLIVDGNSQAIHSTVTSEDGLAKTTVRIGAAGSNYFAQADIALLSMHDRVLTEQEVETMRAYAKLQTAERVALP